MGTAKAQIESIVDRNFQDLEPGDSVYGVNLFGWQLVANVPPYIAESWVIENFPKAKISRSGDTPSNAPMKYWGEGVGVIVGSVTAIPGHERLNLLHKHGEEDFRLYLSEETIPPLDID